jgi:hypothetical protein
MSAPSSANGAGGAEDLSFMVMRTNWTSTASSCRRSRRRRPPSQCLRPRSRATKRQKRRPAIRARPSRRSPAARNTQARWKRRRVWSRRRRQAHRCGRRLTLSTIRTRRGRNQHAGNVGGAVRPAAGRQDDDPLSTRRPEAQKRHRSQTTRTYFDPSQSAFKALIRRLDEIAGARRSGVHRQFNRCSGSERGSASIAVSSA